jgi:VanZ family protein
MLSVLLSSLYGVTDELHQAFVPGRVASIGDLVADSIGAFTGSYIARLVNKAII